MRIEHLSLVRKGRTILDDVSLTVDQGELVVVAGHNGAGKSALLKVIYGEITPTRGSVVGRPATGRLTYLPQGANVFPSLTVAEHYRLYGLTADKLPGEGSLANHKRAGLLSGGEKQWLAAARLAGQSPALVLADELTTGLSPVWREKLLREFQAHVRSVGAAALLVEHNVREAIQIADRLVVLARGKVSTNANATDFRDNPKALEDALTA